MGEVESEGAKPGKARPGPKSKPPHSLSAITAEDVAKIIRAARPPVAPKESDAEEASRLKLAEDQQSHRNKVEWFVLVVGALICLACAVVLFTAASDDIKKGAFATITALASAGLGFIAGRGSKSS